MDYSKNIKNLLFRPIFVGRILNAIKRKKREERKMKGNRQRETQQSQNDVEKWQLHRCALTEKRNIGLLAK